ncbi:MAG: AMP-binding protein [Solirubrobacteraceae bacterium]
MQVEGWLERAAAIAPNVTAVQGPEGALTYTQLRARARRGARELTGRGARPGQRVGIALPPGVAFAEALHSCLLVGAVAVPIDLRLTAAERGRLAEGAVVVVDEPLACATDEPSVGDGGVGASVEHDLDAVAVVIHTSGTTSTPKTVELTYGNLLWSALGSAVALGLDPHERWLCALPLSHVGGLSILVRSAIYATTAVVHERFDTERVLHAIAAEDVTLVSLVSTTLARLLDAGLREPPRLRCALTGGGPVPPALVRRARAAGVPVRETYGLTECCSQAATAAFGSEHLGAGAPLFCTRVEVASDGEILLCGPTVAPSALAEDGRLHTGDLGRLDDHGFLHVSGRKADTIVTGGENVSPTEVEAVLEAHPAVLEAAVLGREDAEWGEAVSAIVVLRAPVEIGERVDVGEDQLREHCAARLAPFKVPKRFTLVSDPLPRTRSGKLLRRELR